MLKSLYLKNFRNFTSAAVTFRPGVNLIQGPNGAGKTNLLEAVYYLSTGRSFRTSKPTELIKQDAREFSLLATYLKNGIEHKLEVTFDGTSKRIRHNDSPSHILGLLPSSIHAPKDIALINGAPQERRRFYNLLISQIDPLYVHHLVRFGRALKQRNALLKAKREDAMEPFEVELAKSATYLAKRRREITSALPFAKEAFSLTGLEFKIKYEPSHAGDLLLALKNHRKKEMLLGTTLVGPHRDDFEVCLANVPARSFASEGERRIAIAALKIAEASLLEDPMFSIDDFGMHLDQGRLEKLAEHLKSMSQVFLTTPQEIPLTPSACYRIDSGAITQEL
ncbi:MAG: DNA replication and repair protein RecF [Chlamydiia bacterium]|nr:DNA replication and repair protein RecF [Chlamydiia bacterium]MCH9615583.1 DNA replication and repair protein RecF [Chlamydiia bacterium]MCH9629238.1 DNA replication and repair protein RecF [Chlamydiia bacterium]